LAKRAVDIIASIPLQLRLKYSGTDSSPVEDLEYMIDFKADCVALRAYSQDPSLNPHRGSSDKVVLTNVPSYLAATEEIKALFD
jgi:hypothetical protein